MNPEKDATDWPAGDTGDTDSGRLSHIGQENNPQPDGPDGGSSQSEEIAAVAALHHVDIVTDGATVGTSTNVSSCDGDGKFAVWSLYPKWTNSPTNSVLYSPPVNYSEVNSNHNFTVDKPRINFITQTVAATLDNTPAYFNRRVVQWFAWCEFLPANYVHDTDSARETLMQVVGGGDNDFDLSIVGNANGQAEWNMERQVNGPGLPNTWSKTNGWKSNVTAGQIGTWTVHVIKMVQDNRTVAAGGSPEFKWWICTNKTNCSLIANDTTNPFGTDVTEAGRGWFFQWNLYKGSWHGDTSPGYEGRKNAPLIIGKDGLRIGDATSSFQDVHPTRQAQP
jgi:hypothetical protein